VAKCHNATFLLFRPIQATRIDGRSEYQMRCIVTGSPMMRTARPTEWPRLLMTPESSSPRVAGVPARVGLAHARLISRSPVNPLCSVELRKHGAQVAKLYFHYSAMNAGKTTTLLQSAWNYRERGMRTLILAPTLADRLGTDAVASRIGLKAAASRFAPGDNLLQLVRDDIDRNGALHCVFVDEAQFLTKVQVWQLTDVVDVLGVPVLAYGLRTDFRGELFAGSSYLLAWADELHEIKTICHTGHKATMVVRMDASGRPVTEGPQVEIGGNERYVSVSRAEFKKIMQRADHHGLPHALQDADEPH
jgi:thymidine kinase